MIHLSFNRVFALVATSARHLYRHRVEDLIRVCQEKGLLP